MDDVITSSAVASLDVPKGDGDGTLQLKDGTRCTLGGKDPRFMIWLRILKGAQNQGMPVYAECAPGGGAAKTILPFAARQIEQVDAPQGDKAAVLIFMSPSIHYLRTANPRYAAIRAVLEESAKTRQPVLLAVDPRTLDILAAVKPDPGMKVTPI